jgi:hypothetical protein
MQHQCVALGFPTKSEMPTGAAGRAVYEAINRCSDPAQLDDVGRRLWLAYGEGRISEGDATYLSSCIDRRRPLGRCAAGGAAKSLDPLGGRLGSRFTPRPCRKRSPEHEKRRNRRRMLGGSSALPDNLRPHYTEGERAVLCIVAGEVKRHGICDLTIGEIADRAGVCRTTVQNTLHEARRLYHLNITERPQYGRNSLTNIVRITSAEWLNWIRRGPSAARFIGPNSLKMVSTTKNKEESKRAIEEERCRQWGPSARFGPPDMLARRA